MKRKVMVVDDNGSLLFLLKEGIEEQGNEVFCFSNAEEALKSDFEPDVIVSDINMPGGMNGIELAKKYQIKKPTIPVILMTALTPQPANYTPAVALLGKPFSMNQLNMIFNNLGI